MSVNREAIAAIVPVAQLVATGFPERRVVIKVNVINIGRAVSGEHDIILDPDDELASRNHAILRRESTRWYLEDTSRNGTLVNDTLVNKQKVELHEEDRIRIGRSFDFTFHEVGVTRDQKGFEFVESAASIGTPHTHETPPSNRGIWISPSAAVWRDGILLPASLSRTEYRLVKFLVKQPGDVADYNTTIQAVWGMPRDKDSLHELIYRIRRKIEPDPAAPRYLIIRAGIGVVFFPQGADSTT
jgi:DNA-binding response OmpR family regulator